MAGACPPPSALESLALGGHAAPGAREHAQTCPACRALLDEIRENQQFLRGAARALASTLDVRSSPAGAAASVPGFELLEEISRGGQGIIYRAIQSATK